MKRRVVRRPAQPVPHPSWSREDRPRPERGERGERQRLMLRFWDAVDAS